MTFSQTLKQISNLTINLWQLQSNWIMLTAGLYGFSYLFAGNAANLMLLIASLLQMALFVYWMKVGTKTGDFNAEAFAQVEQDWIRYIGITIGSGLVFAIIFLFSNIFILLGPPGWVLIGFIWFVILLLLELYSPLVSVRAQGFSHAFSMTVALLRKLKNIRSLATSAFWYPALLALAVSFLDMLINPTGGLFSAIVGFAFAVLQIPWYAAAQLVLYKNIWAMVASREIAEGDAAE